MRRPVALFCGIFLWAAACSTDQALAPGRVLPIEPGMAILPGSCALVPRFGSVGYFGFANPDTITRCTVKATFFARSTAAEPNATVWYYGAIPESVYLSTGSTLGSPNGKAPLEITFDKAVMDVQAVWQFGSVTGSRITLYDHRDSVLGTMVVGTSPEPSPYGAFNQETHTFTARNVRRVLLEPNASLINFHATARFLAQIFFRPDTICPPTGDSILDHGRVRDSLVKSLERSNPDSAPGTGNVKERGGIIYRLTDGTFLAIEVMSPQFASSNECGYNLNAAGVPRPVPGAVEVGIFHTHPHAKGEAVYGCQAAAGQPALAQTPGDGKIVPTASPDANGGGSPGDWTATAQGFPHYVINEGGRIYRLDPDTPPAQQPLHPNRWEWKQPSRPGCLTRIP